MCSKYILNSIIVFVFFIFFGNLSAQWVEKANMPTARHHPAGFGIGEYGYVVSGSTNFSGFTNHFYRYDPNLDQWEQLDNFPGNARSYAYGIEYNGKAYFGFGIAVNDNYLNDLWVYDPEVDEWTELTSCPCSGRMHPAFVAHNDKLFVGMGNNNFNLNDWWEYDMNTDSWTQRPNLPGNGRHHPFHFQAGDYVFAGLGHGSFFQNGYTIYKDWYRYDLNTNNWTQMNDMPGLARVAGTEFSYNGKGYVLSGDGPTHDNLAEGEFWEYDPDTDTWVQFPSHPGQSSRWAPGSFVIDNTVYFFGGMYRSNTMLHNSMWSFNFDEYVTVENNELKYQELKVYPNPAEDNISFSQNIFDNGKVQIHVYDSRGSLVLNQSTDQNKIDISALTQGLYIVQLHSHNNEVYQLKFLKQ